MAAFAGALVLAGCVTERSATVEADAAGAEAWSVSLPYMPDGWLPSSNAVETAGLPRSREEVVLEPGVPPVVLSPTGLPGGSAAGGAMADGGAGNGQAMPPGASAAR